MGFFDSIVGKKDKNYWLNLGNSYLKNNKRDEAIESFKEILKQDPNDFHAWKNIGDVYYKKFQFDLALSAYDKALEVNPNDIEILSNKADIQINKKNFTESLEISNRILDIFPDNQRCLYLKARALFSLNQKEEAVNILYKILKINPKLPDVWQELAFELTILERDEEAYDAYKQLLKISQNDTHIWHLWKDFASFLELSENYEEAIFALEKAMELSGFGTDLEMISMRADLYEKIDRKDVSKPLFEWILSTCNHLLLNDGVYTIKKENGTSSIFCPINHALEYKAQALLGLKKYDSALQTCEKILKNNSKSYNGLLLKARGLCGIQQYEQAAIILDQTIILYPKARKAKKLKEKIQIKTISKTSIEKDISSALLNSKIALSPVDSFVSKKIPPRQPQIIRAYEFYSGYIRLKISVKNPTPFTIHDVILEPDIDRAILYLEQHEPEEYLLENERIILGIINPNNDRTVSLYLEPIICAKEGTDVHCHVRYKDAQGHPGSLDMEPLRIQVVCPIFETKEPVNIGSLKQLIDSLPSRDTKIFSVPRTLDASTQLKIFQSVIQLHDIQHISTLKRAKNFESWYYGKTKVTQKDMVLKLGIVKDMDLVEITAFSIDPKDLTGLLAEITRHVTEEVSKRENIQKIFNVTIKDSVVQRTNLMSFCDANGKCSGDVTIEDSVVMRSNIG